MPIAKADPRRRRRAEPADPARGRRSPRTRPSRYRPRARCRDRGNRRPQRDRRVVADRDPRLGKAPPISASRAAATCARPAPAAPTRSPPGDAGERRTHDARITWRRRPRRASSRSRPNRPLSPRVPAGRDRRPRGGAAGVDADRDHSFIRASSARTAANNAARPAGAIAPRTRGPRAPVTSGNSAGRSRTFRRPSSAKATASFASGSTP